MAGHSLEAVLQALIKGIEICREMGLQCIKMEGDCLILVESLKMRGESIMAAHGVLVEV